MRSIFIFLVLPLLSFSCKNNPDSVVSLKILAKDNKSNAIANAEVFLDNSKIGTTDATGQLTKTLSLKKNSSSVLEVKKDDLQYYYSPFIQKQQVTDVDSQDVQVQAVLYFVPKLSDKSDEQGDDIPQKSATPEKLPADIKVASSPETVTEDNKAPIQAHATQMQSSTLTHQTTEISTLNHQETAVSSVKHKPLEPTKLKKKKGGFAVEVTVHTFIQDGDQQVGIADIVVSSQGEELGKTDINGNFSTPVYGTKDSLSEITLAPPKATNLLPESFSTDFVLSQNFTIHKMFSHLIPKIPTLGISTSKTNDSKQKKFLHRLSIHLTQTKAVSTTILNKDEIAGNKSLNYVLIPKFENKGVSLKVFNIKNQLFLDFFQLTDTKNDLQVQKVYDAFSDKLFHQIPLEASILKVEKNSKVFINIGTASKKLKPGDRLFVYGMQIDKTGQSKEHSLIAEIEVAQMNLNTSECEVIHLNSRSFIQVGDQVLSKDITTGQLAKNPPGHLPTSLE